MKSNGTNLQIIKKELFDYLDTYAKLDDVMYTDENKEILDSINEPKTMFQKISEVSKGNYHEIAWEFWNGGRMIEKGYYLRT